MLSCVVPKGMQRNFLYQHLLSGLVKRRPMRPVGRLTLLVLQQPDLQLDEAVSVEALVLPPAAVAHLVATNIQLALRIQGSDLGVSDRVLLKNVNQTPTRGERG